MYFFVCGKKTAWAASLETAGHRLRPLLYNDSTTRISIIIVVERLLLLCTIQFIREITKSVDGYVVQVSRSTKFLYLTLTLWGVPDRRTNSDRF